MFTVLEEKKDEESESLQLVLAIDPSLYKVLNDITKADQTLYKDVIIEMQDAKPVEQMGEEKKETKKKKNKK